MRKLTGQIWLLTMAMGILTGCSSVEKTTSTSRQTASIYNPSEISLNTDYKIYHSNDELSTLFIRIIPSELLFSQANEKAEYLARVNLDVTVYELLDEEESRQKADSLSVEIQLGKNDMDKSSFITSMMLRLFDGKKYILELKSRDIQRGSFGIKYLYVDKQTVYSSQNFNLFTAASGIPKFRNYLLDGEVFRFDHRVAGIDSVYLDVLRTDGDYPRPPVSIASPPSYPYIVDTTYVIGYSESRLYTLPGEGVFFLRIDSSVKEGITLMNFNSTFPQIKSEEGLFNPLFYVATNAEFNDLKKSNNKKLAVDEFWLARNPSLERSRELIRIYYNRVLYSNLYFTSDREGWKTDRGMVFILFGPPDRMLDIGSRQAWYYISRRRNKVIQFNFERKPDRYAYNNFVWEKDVESMGYWNEAVRSWRNGKVFSLSN